MNRAQETHEEFKESDWKLFRKRVIVWQEKYMNQLNKEYIILLKQDKNPSDIFWELEKRIKKDQRKPGVILDMSRSQMIVNILSLLDDNVIVMDDLQGFSDIFIDTITTYLSYRR